MIRTVPVDTARLELVAAGEAEPVAVWEDAADGRRTLTDRQEVDETAGLPLWTIYALVQTGGRPEVLAVRVPARHQPVVTPLAPVDLHGLEVRVSINKSGVLTGYWSAVGIADPNVAEQARRNGNGRAAAPAETPA
ncbi:hypothetical protein ACQPX6_17555 [Actinomycetospora sp. CA-101289]|uniref:hypothetical protein n=1 Tax=Actinomycetospora sp. CA-101289 TaxID=3239893 RepID=UPI003D96E01D